MELGFIESDREKPLVKIINNLGGWEVLRSFNLYSWDSHRVLKRLHAEYNVNAFFRVEVVPDVRDPTRNIIRIAPDGLGMPHKSFYHRLPTDSAVQVRSASAISDDQVANLLFMLFISIWKLYCFFGTKPFSLSIETRIYHS